MRLKETITRVRVDGPRNRHGERTGTERRDDVTGCSVWPRTSVETGEEVVIDGYNVFVPANAKPFDIAMDFTASDRVVCRGEEWDIEGTPGNYRPKGILLLLKRTGAA